MNKRAFKRDEQGLTLVEILATLVIIGIVFIGIMAIFPQMTFFNERTEVKLDAMNIARNEMALLRTVQSDSFDTGIGADFEAIHPDVDVINSDMETTGEIVLSYLLPDGYYVEAKISPSDSDEEFHPLYLHKVHLAVFEDTGRQISETFGYLEINQIKSGSPS